MARGEDLHERRLLERKRLLRSIIPRKPSYIGYVSFTNRQAAKLFELVKTNDLEGASGEEEGRQISSSNQVVQGTESQLLAKNRAGRIVSVATASK